MDDTAEEESGGGGGHGYGGSSFLSLPPSLLPNREREEKNVLGMK